jgi:hypothetical protein
MFSPTLRLVRAAALFIAISLISGCGGSSPPAQEPAPEQEQSPGATPAPAAATADSKPAAAPEPAQAATDTPPPVKKDDPDNRKRQVYYRSTPDGLAVSIEGVEFTIKAAPKKLDNGGFGITINVQAEAKDDGMHTLLSPKNGPLAVGGTIKRKKGGEETITDKRDGEDEQFIAPGTALEFVHEWPGKDGPFAWWGDEIELQVGLWGVGAAGERRRPVMKLCIIKMVAVKDGKPVVMPPKI